MLEKQGKKIINLGIGQPDFKTPEHIVDASVEALKNGEHGYTEGKGILKLREAVASDIFKRRKVEVDPENIVIVPGGKVTMWHAIIMFGGEGKEIIYPNPGFPIYESVINYSGAKPIPIRLDIVDNFKINFEELESSINNNTSLIIINFPSNPTGGIISKKETNRFLNNAQNLKKLKSKELHKLNIEVSSKKLAKNSKKGIF